MSKNIVIQEGGLGKQLTADKLKTNLVGGGTCLLVPEDETQLGTKYITNNGTFKASDDGLYGYSEVTVSGIGTATGTGPDGETHSYTEDGVGGITDTVLPDSIIVVTPPINPYGVYTDGQAITKDGMVVKGYLKSGEEWGIIPNNETTLDPTSADFSKTSGTRQSTYSEFGQGPWPNPINSSIGSITYQYSSGDYDAYNILESSKYVAILLDINGHRRSTIFCSDSPGTWKEGEQIGTPWPIVHTGTIGNQYTHDGKTVYYKIGSAGLNWAGVSGSNIVVSGTDLDEAKAAWVIVYGTETQVANTQTINVSWPRPLDGKVLETTFEILVAPPYSSGED